jgi:hypothetical protein
LDRALTPLALVHLTGARGIADLRSAVNFPL